MIFIQLTGLSGAGKSTIANGTKELLVKHKYRTEVIDADVYRKMLCPDLGFSREDRNENIRRLGFVANLLSANQVIAILAAINPYEAVRQYLSAYGSHVKTVWIDCDINTLIKRDTKLLYAKAMLSDGHPEKIYNLTGINDPFEPPVDPDLIIHTDKEQVNESVKKLFDFIINETNNRHLYNK